MNTEHDEAKYNSVQAARHGYRFLNQEIRNAMSRGKTLDEINNALVDALAPIDLQQVQVEKLEAAIALVKAL